MMWDFSGGRRSPQLPPRMPTPAFPAPQVYPPPSSMSHAPNNPSSYPPLPLYGSSQGPPIGMARSDPFDLYQPPSAPQFLQATPTTVVIHHSSHHSKHSHSHRDRRHSHSGAAVPAPVPQVSQVPQVPIYTSRSYPKPAITYPPNSQQIASPSHRPPSHLHNPNHVTFQPSSSSKLKAPPDPEFQYYSRCTGRRRALCIGINYRGQSNQLRGCVNDARRVREFLIKKGGYKHENVVLLTDDASDPRQLPTRKNIIACMKWLVRGAQANDALFFHYSGHGGQTPDLDGDEIDGYDEVIFPLDFKKTGHISDDEMHDLMVKPLAAGCRLTGLFDACHSGTVLDLPYIYSSHGRLKGSHIRDSARARKATRADVISWSGCKDGQTSADTFQGGVAVGAMSHAFIEALTTNPNQTYQELLRSVRLILHPRFSQKPQLGSSHHINTNLRFVF